LLAFIRMKELPQMIHNKTNIPQLTSLSFFIMFAKVINQRQNKAFFLYCESFKI
jgi:hypothetical protein